MVAKLWNGAVIAARIFAVAFAAAVPIGIYLQHKNIVSISMGFEIAVWVTGLVVLGVDNIGTLISRKVHKDRARQDAALDEILMQLLVAVSKAKNARLEELGASVWLKRRVTSPRYWWRKEVVLRRRRRFRPMNYPHQSNITWTSRMGLVGACWTSSRRCYRKLWAFSSKYDEETLIDLTQDQFDAISPKSRNGFTLDEFKATAGKYSEVAATPIFSAGQSPKLIGVLSIDRGMPELKGGEAFRPALDNPRVREDIQVIVELIGRLLSKPD